MRGSDLVTDEKGKKPMYCLNEPCSATNCRDAASWTKPAPGWCKLNFDAGFSEETNTGSWGVILRDENGKNIHTAWGKTEYCPTAEVVEAIAGIQRVKAILPACAEPVHVENDSAAVITALKSRVQDKSSISGLISEIKELLNLTPGFEVSKVKRANNVVAHELAKLGRSVSVPVLSVSAPTCVSDLIKHDCIGCNTDSVST